MEQLTEQEIQKLALIKFPFDGSLKSVGTHDVNKSDRDIWINGFLSCQKMNKDSDAIEFTKWQEEYYPCSLTQTNVYWDKRYPH